VYGGALAKDAFERGPCTDIEEKIQTFLLVDSEATAAPPSCYDEPSEKARNDDALKDARAHSAAGLFGKTADLRFVVAILPDPLHTHFSLVFDRTAEAVQQSAQDTGYYYDSSWLPWETEEKPLVLLADQDRADDQIRAREEQPGILLFRRKHQVYQDTAQQPYADGLVVFVVGEEPTGGIHKPQFENAVAWIDWLRDSSEAPSTPVAILGPTFSGSLPSLAQLLAEQAGQFKRDLPLRIYSGSVSSEVAVRGFQTAVAGLPQVEFHSFLASDETILWNYRDYLEQEGFDIQRLAIVSEDETAYGQAPVEGTHAIESVCGPSRRVPGAYPACLYYPRDISALRDAYQKQSIFNAGSTENSETVRRTLSSDVADPEGKQHDTIRAYSGQQTPLSQEAVLQQIVSMLRGHRSEYVVLRSSNPMDQLFLAHYLRLTYPEGRVVMQGSDLLLRRETGAATLSGIMTLTTYPLLPWEHHWTWPTGNAATHSHRIFAQDLAEGTYVAGRFLLHTAPPSAPGYYDLADCGATESDAFLPANCQDISIPDYAPPFWARSSEDHVSEAQRRPANWLSVLGRDGFWPLAALNRDTLKLGEETPGIWSKLRGAIYSLPSDLQYLLPQWLGGPTGEIGKAAPTPWNTVWPPMPLGMKVCLAGIVLWAIFHFYCCVRPSLTVKPGHRAHFVRIPGKSHPALILIGSFAISMIPIILAWGYGSMWRVGEPSAHPWPYRFLLPSVWFICLCAVGRNEWIESLLTSPMGARPAAWTGPRPWMRPVVLYTIVTWFFYGIVDFWLDEALGPGNRIPTYWRAVNLTNGVSPLLPLIALAAGLYFWFWYSLQGLALFGPDRPRLPEAENLTLQWPDGKTHKTLSMFSEKMAAEPIEILCRPFAPEISKAALAAFVGIIVIALCSGDGVPIRSLGHINYAIFFSIWMCLCVCLMLANCWQLLRIWVKLRQLLVFIDRLPLRRTLQVLKGYSWGTVWKMAGNVLDVRWKLISRQMETLTHLWNCPCSAETADAPHWYDQIFETLKARGDFADWYEKSWDKDRDRDLMGTLTAFQASAARTTAVLLTEVLVRRWRGEKKSLLLEEHESGTTVVDVPEKKSLVVGLPWKKWPLLKIWGKEDAIRQEEVSDELPEFIRNAEELVCLVYLGFIQNVLGRMRTLVMQLLFMFIAVSISVATYPFDPRSALSGAMFVLFVIIGIVIVVVYSQMHRDATLSYVTNTTPGELGTEFWFKLISFGIGPLLGLLATLFPELTGTIFNWLQPGLASLK
jgi:hypothetical protein